MKIDVEGFDKLQNHAPSRDKDALRSAVFPAYRR
jgi:hypothetical protein